MATRRHSTHLRALLAQLQESEMMGDDAFCETLRRAAEELDEGEALLRSMSSELASLKPLEDSLKTGEAAFHSLINAIPDLVFQKDAAGYYVNCNEAFASYVGKSREEIQGSRPRELFHTKAAHILEKDDLEVIAKGEPVRRDTWVGHGQRKRLFDTIKTPYFSEEGEILGLVGVSREITARHKMEVELRRLATTDPLTESLNRRSLMLQAKEEVARARRYRRPLSLLMLDLDHFKSINDQYGHDIGDEALKETARRCSEMLRHSDLFGRYGGEEFLIVLPEADIQQALTTAERLRAALEAQPVSLAEGTLSLTISIGCASLWVGADDNLDQLLKRADIALYQAKASGRNRVESY